MQEGISGKIASFFMNSKLTILLMVALMIIGTYSSFLIPREEEPQINVPMADVMIGYPGASPSEVESRVIKPLEKVLSNIKGVELDKQQKETLKSGKELILNVDKEKIAIRLDLNNPRGIKFLDFEQKQKIAYDRHNPQIIGTIHTDKNRNEYIEYMKGQKTALGNESQSKVEHKFKL